MSFSVAGAIFMIASVSGDASSHVDFQRYAQTHEKADLAEKVLSVFAGAATAAAVYKMSEDPIEFYPVRAQANSGGLNFSESLSVNRGGFRFQLSTISLNNGYSVSAAPDYRKDARKMSNILPGYPQPARIVVGVKINY